MLTTNACMCRWPRQPRSHQVQRMAGAGSDARQRRLKATSGYGECRKARATTRHAIARHTNNHERANGEHHTRRAHGTCIANIRGCCQTSTAKQPQQFVTRGCASRQAIIGQPISFVALLAKYPRGHATDRLPLLCASAHQRLIRSVGA
eukprot:938791-Pleurochrysis_carterae.AAC.3